MAIKEQTVGFWKGLPTAVKGVIVLGVLVGGFFLYRKIKKSSGANKEEKEVGGELNQLIESGIKPTLSPTEATSIVEGLYHSMNGYNPATREDTHIPNFKKYFYRIKNKADLFLVIQKWDAKENSSLRDWIVKEYESPKDGGSITSGIYATMELPKDVANNHLKYQGIDYRF